MAQGLRATWSTNRHWLAAGFLASTGLFLLLMFVNRRNEHRGNAAQRATGLASSAGEPASLWLQKSILPSFPRRQRAPTGVDYSYGTLGGVPGGVRPDSVDSRLESEVDNTDRQVIRSGTLEIIVTDPLQAADQLRDLASQFSGFVASSKVNGSDERARSAQVTMRIPAKHLDEARAQVRAIAKAVEEDTIEARDVTREYVDQEAKLRDFRAEEAQYLAILKRATAVKDVLEVSSKLADVRGRTDELEADLRFLRHQVEMSLLTVNITAMAEAQVLGIRWRPLYRGRLALRGALSAMADYGDSMVELFLNFPVIAMWGFTIVALLKIGWMMLRRIVLLFFPRLATWLRRPVESQAT